MIAVIVLLTVAASSAIAGTSFSGTGSGWVKIGTTPSSKIYPFQPWMGSVNAGDNEFNGCWGNDLDNWIYGEFSHVENGIFYVQPPNYYDLGTWAYEDNELGTWMGYFDTVEDTAAGNWFYLGTLDWSGPNNNDFWSY